MTGDRDAARRAAVFLAVTVGLAYAVGAGLFLTGGLRDSAVLVAVPGLELTVAAVAVPTAYMFSPAVGNGIARLLTGEGRADLWLRPRIDRGFRYYAFAWVGVPALILAGAGLHFLLFGGFDPAAGGAIDLFGRAAVEGTGLSPLALTVVQFLAGVFLNVAFVALFTFGEEVGWRGYLLGKLLALTGPRRALVAVGVVWGVWHYPLVAMGHNYGVGYPGAPWTGLLAMTWFTVVLGVVLGWATLRAGSVWPAVIGHASMNANAWVGLAFAAGDPSPLVGPTPVGVVGSLPFATVAAWVLADPDRARPDRPGDGTAADAPDGAGAGTGAAVGDG